VTSSSSAIPRTAEEIAAGELRAAVVRGDLAPGEKIRQEATAAELGVSLIPLREALRRLAGEGLLTYLPQRGYFVAEHDDEAIRQLAAARNLLEAEIERLAVPRLDEADLRQLRADIKAEERAAEDRDAVAMIAANRDFHFTIFERCGNPWLLRFVRQTWDAIDPYRVLTYKNMWLEGDEQLIPSEILAEHLAIVDRLECGDHAGSLRLLAKHRKRAEVFLKSLTSGPG
jgi:DNA-binding GntR family transcriptional regulator